MTISVVTNTADSGETQITTPILTAPAYANAVTQGGVVFTVTDPDTDLASTSVVVSDASGKSVTASLNASGQYVADVSGLAQGMLNATVTATRPATSPVALRR